MTTPEFTPEKFPLAISHLSRHKKPFKYWAYSKMVVDADGKDIAMPCLLSAPSKITEREFGEMICAFLNSLEIPNT